MTPPRRRASTAASSSTVPITPPTRSERGILERRLLDDALLARLDLAPGQQRLGRFRMRADISLLRRNRLRRLLRRLLRGLLHRFLGGGRLLLGKRFLFDSTFRDDFLRRLLRAEALAHRLAR